MFRQGWHRTHARNVGIGMLIVSVGCFFSPLAAAAVSNFGDFHASRQLSDAELAGHRGRFVDRGKLMFFGVQMRSDWKTPDGQYLSAEARFLGDVSGSGPTVTFEPRLTLANAGGDTSPVGNGARVVDAGTDNARGVVQTIQAGGDFNAASNDLQVDVLDASRFQPGSSAPSGMRARRLASGTRLSISSGGRHGPPGVELAIPGVGRVQQSIVPSRGLRQAIQLSSDGQQVRNLTRLQLFMDRRRDTVGATGLRSALESVRGLERR